MDNRQPIERLVLVYNANSGTVSAVIDSMKKLFQLNGCTLCSITHGLAGEKDEWKSCKEEIGVEIDYVHRDEVTPALAAVIKDQYPCILAKTADKEVLLLTPEVLDRCKGSISDLKGRLRTYAAMNKLFFPAWESSAA
jgi:hypothetical protein